MSLPEVRSGTFTNRNNPIKDFLFEIFDLAPSEKKLDNSFHEIIQISLCNTRQFGSCRANNPSCPDPPPDLPATGVAERQRFFKPGYRGLGEPHMLPEKEMQPYGGYVDIQKTAASGQETFYPIRRFKTSSRLLWDLPT